MIVNLCLMIVVTCDSLTGALMILKSKRTPEYCLMVTLFISLFVPFFVEFISEMNKKIYLISYFEGELYIEIINI